MHFYHPNFLYGLLALAIPIIIHLFNFKRFEKVYFANLNFLKEIQQQSKHHSQLLHLIILFLRMLFIALLVFAFAGPYISKKQNTKTITEDAYINVFLDNSFSMQARASEGSIFDEGRKIARQIALSHKATDHYRLLTNDKSSFSRNFVNRDIFIEQLDKLQINKSSLLFSQIPQRIYDNSIKESLNQDLYIISDFQKKQADISNIKADTNIQLKLIPLEAAVQGNLFIDSIWIDNPILQTNRNISIGFRIENNSNIAAEDVSIVLKVGAKQKAIASVSIDAFGNTKSTLNFRTDTAGLYDARIIIEDYPIVYDDIFFFSFIINNTIPTLCISGRNSNKDIQTYLKSDSIFNEVLYTDNNINYSSFAQYNSIIINGIDNYSNGLAIELSKFVNSGGNLIIIPNSTNRIEDLNNFYKNLGLPIIKNIDSNKTNMQFIDIESPEFSNIFDLPKNTKQLKDNTNLPYFNQRYIIAGYKNTISLIKDETSESILDKTNIGRGSIYCFNVPLESSKSNFSTHAIFVPIFFNILQVQHNSNPPYYFLGTDKKFEIKINEQENNLKLKLTKENDSLEFIPQYNFISGKLSLSFQHQPNEAGIYKLSNGPILLSKIAFNYDRKESYLDYYSYKKLSKILTTNKLNNATIFKPNSGNISKQIAKTEEGLPLWKLFITIAISILIIELFLLRFSKY